MGSTSSNFSSSIPASSNSISDRSGLIFFDENTVIERGAIIGYPIPGKEIVNHWGIYVGNGYVISKYGNGKIEKHRLGEEPWANFIFIQKEGHAGLADKAIEVKKLNPDSDYNIVDANCQEWVRDLAYSVGAPCPMTASKTTLLTLATF